MTAQPAEVGFSRPPPAAGPVQLALILLAGFSAAVLLRSAIGGAAVARSTTAALVFAGLLIGLTLLAAPNRPGRSGRRLPIESLPLTVRAVAIGLSGAAVLCLPAVVHRVAATDVVPRPANTFLGWALVVTVVASAEESFLRGALYRVLEPFGTLVAIAVPALAFAAMHVPLYGWGAVPLDLAVGVWLGALRAVAGSAVAPAVAHVVANWAAWGLV
jgi:hypothetical protein